MTCPDSNHIQYTIQDNDSPEHIVVQLGISEDQLANAMWLQDSDGNVIASRNTSGAYDDAGSILCIPPASPVVENDSTQAVPEEHSGNNTNVKVATEQDEHDYETLEELYRSTNVPNYLLRTEEDFLRYLWVTEFSSKLEDFNIDEARLFLSMRIQTELNLLRQSPAKYLLPEDTSDSITTFLNSDDEAATQFLATLTTEELFALYAEAGGAIYETEYGTSFPNYTDYANYASIWENIQAVESGELPPATMSGDYQRNLALQDFMENQAFDSYGLIQMMAAMLMNAADTYGGNYEAWRTIQIGDYDATNLPAIEAALRDYLIGNYGENFTYEDVLSLSTDIAGDFNNISGSVGQYQQTSFNQAAYDQSQMILNNAADYESSLALDELRAIAFDPNWNESGDAALLSQLFIAIGNIPPTVLGVDVSWVTNIFSKYHDAMLAQHQWRVDLKSRMVEIELAMLERQEDDGNPLWWVGMLGEAVLGTLFEPLDWVFTLRDLASGNPYALVGFLPFIPSAAGRLAKVVRYMDNIPEGLASLARYADNFMSVTDDMLLPYADDTWAAIQQDADWYQRYRIPESSVPRKNYTLITPLNPPPNIEARRWVTDATDFVQHNYGYNGIDLNTYAIFFDDASEGAFSVHSVTYKKRITLHPGLSSPNIPESVRIRAVVHELVHATQFEDLAAIVGMDEAVRLWNASSLPKGGSSLDLPIQAQIIFHLREVATEDIAIRITGDYVRSNGRFVPDEIIWESEDYILEFESYLKTAMINFANQSMNR